MAKRSSESIMLHPLVFVLGFGFFDISFNEIAVSGYVLCIWFQARYDLGIAVILSPHDQGDKFVFITMFDKNAGAPAQDLQRI